MNNPRFEHHHRAIHAGEHDELKRGVSGLCAEMFDVDGVAKHITYNTWLILPEAIKTNPAVVLAVIHRSPSRTALVLDHLPVAAKEELLSIDLVHKLYHSPSDEAPTIYALHQLGNNAANDHAALEAPSEIMVADSEHGGSLGRVRQR